MDARAAWRALGVFWAVVLAGGIGTVGVLHWLGAPEGPARLASPQPAPRAAAPAARAAGSPAAPSPEAGSPRAVSPAAGSLAAGPDAAPLPAAAARAGAPSPASPGREELAAALPLPAPPLPEPPLAGTPLPAPQGGVLAAPLPPPAALPEPAPPPEAPPPPPLPEPGLAGRGGPVIAAPRPALLEESPHGPLPRIGPGGAEPRTAYARPFDAADARPRIALVIGGFGGAGLRAEEALRRLPPAATLAISPLALRPDLLLEPARRRGMEVVLALPLESPGDLPAGHLLRASLPPGENLERLHRAMGRFAGYAGVVGALGAQRGERFLASPEALAVVQEEVRARGLYYVDPRPGATALAWHAAADLLLDELPTRGEVEHRLSQLESLAQRHGRAVGLAAEPTPLLVDRIAAWAAGLEARGLVLAPASAVLHAPDNTPIPSASR
ncbi:divergent polysaccharide deacetylase family protein [Teichococcus aestuarii]|nr:divergent polysaccharide deacetylase family protein [Pseudoroseomonas aestuarii]